MSKQSRLAGIVKRGNQCKMQIKYFKSMLGWDVERARQWKLELDVSRDEYAELRGVR